MDNDVLPWREQIVHLGHTICANLSDLPDQTSRKLSFNFQFNSILPSLSFLPSDVRAHIFTTYCSSFYGSVLWRLSESLNPIFTSWRKAVRRLFIVPPNTHCNILPCLLNSLAVNDFFVTRFVQFYHACRRSSNTIVNLLSRVSADSTSFHFGYNIRQILHKYSSLSSKHLHDQFVSTYSYTEASVLRDIIDCYIPSLSDDDVHLLFFDVACR